MSRSRRWRSRQLPRASRRAQYAGLDKDLTGLTIRMANIGGSPYEAMYEQIKVFEEKTGATVEIVFLGDGFQIDRYLKENYAAGTVDFDVAWNHTSFMSQYTPFVEDLNQYFTPEELAVFSPPIIQAATIDGALQLIPRHADISVMHYRTDLFGDADLQAKFEAEYGYPLAPPETIEQMQQMAEFFVAAGRRGLRHPVRRQGRGAGGPVLRAAGGQRRQLLRREPSSRSSTPRPGR